MKYLSCKTVFGIVLIVLVAIVTVSTVHRLRKPGQIDAVTAQDMDMSQMRPPIGAAPVSLASLRVGSLDNTVTYTGSILPYNEQVIAPRITGTIVSLPVYPGDQVHAGELVAELDGAEVRQQAIEAQKTAGAAEIGAQVAHLTHHLHHRAALDQATAQVDVAQESVSDAQANATAQNDAIDDAQAAVQSAQANADYWQTEIAREKQLADAGAVSQQDYQNELAQSLAAGAAVKEARSKVQQAASNARSAHDKVLVAQQQVIAADAGVRMADADIAVAEGQASQAEAQASAAESSAREAAVVQGYTNVEATASGVVTARPTAPGTLVQPGTEILKIAEIDRVRVQANVAVADLTGIQVGNRVEITTQDGSSPVNAAVSAIFPSADTDTHTAVVESVIDNPGHRLLPGSFVSMTIAQRTDTNKLLAPISAIQSQNGQAYVWKALGALVAQGPIYECVICHIHYTAAQAAKFHYRDPMEGGKLVPLAGSAKPMSSGPITAHQVSVTVTASNDRWAEITSDQLSSSDRVVVQGQAGLTEGAQIQETAWRANGPESLPTAADTDAGQVVYRCDKCGMSFSAADAKKDNYVDPMDGGKLEPVSPAVSSNGSSTGSMPGMNM